MLLFQLVRRRGRSSPENDEGPYRCILTVKEDMEYMISAPPINLHLAELGRHVSVASTNVSVLNGTALRLSCNISSEPIAFLYWQKDGGDLPQDRCTALNDVLNKTRVSEDVTVVVTKPPITQETSSSSSSSSTSATTSGYIPPSFLYPTSNHTIKVVQRWWATFECLANGLPMPSITWKRKGVLATEEEPWEILKEKEIKVNFFGAGNLRIGNVSVKDAGRYLCTASSTNPQTGKVNSISQEIKLVVIVQPRVKRGSQNMTTLMAKTVRLNCSYDDPSMGLLPSGVSSPYFPAPRVIWYKNGVPMKLDTRIQIRENNELMFLNSGTSDSAIYQTSWSYLLVNSSEDHPQPPKQLQAVLLGSTSVWLSWSPENTPGTKIKGYSIHLTEHGPNPFESQVVSHNNSYVFELLKPNTNYSFYVRAYSNYASDPSEVFNFTTREAVPIAAPEFSLQKLSPSSLLVTWSPLSTEKARGKVDGYKIQWQRKKKDYYNLNEVGPHTFECELKGLHPGKTYKVRVLARTKVGYNEGVDWPWKSITLDDAVVNKNLPLPPILHVEPKADLSALLATWERNQSDTVPLTGYSLNYKIGDEPWNEPVFLPHTVTSYSIRISTVPSAPKEMSFEPKDASTVEIRWEESNFDLEESPTKFEIIYTQNKTKPLQEWHHEDVKGDALSFTVSGLVSNTEYWFRIRGCRHDACGSYSDPYPALIPSAFSSTSDPSKMYLIVGLGVAVFILILVILLAIYLFKFRIKQPRPVLTSNANGSVIVNRADGHHHHHHSGGRNGVSDTGEGDYIPMLNRLHTDISATLDTKGGYNNTRVNGFTNPKCNGVVKTKELHCGTNSHSKMDDSEERERLYTPPTCDGEGDTEAISSSYVEICEESSDILKESKQPSSSREPPLTRTYPSDSEGVNSSQ
ncbi:Protogenin [Armadillidium vulgare]|nr:Protogenin [Armadillidium vulgare]